MQTLTLEYRVFDRCDGLTEAPPFSEGVLDDRQIYVFEVARLGRIPLRFDDGPENPPQPSAPANRFITWAVLLGVPVDSEGLSVGFANRVSGNVTAIEPVGQISVGSEALYLRRCIKVPQGGLVVVNNVDAPPGAFAMVRLRVQQAENGEQQQQLELACCCKRSIPNTNVPDTRDTDCPSSLSIVDVSPSVVPVSLVSEVSVTITGRGFSELETTQVVFLNEGAGEATLPVTSVAVLNDTTIVVSVAPNLAGSYSVFVVDPGSLDCFASLENGFTVTES
jgi:hypothetical protein